MKEVDTEKQLRDEVSALKVQIQELQEEKLEAAATVSLEQPDKDTKGWNWRYYQTYEGESHSD